MPRPLCTLSYPSATHPYSQELQNASPTLHIAKGCILQGFKAYYAERNIGSRRYRDRLVETNTTNLIRLCDNVRFTLSKGESICGLSTDKLQQSQLAQLDSQGSQEPSATARRRKRLSRKRIMLRRTKVRKIGATRPVRLHWQADSVMDSWSDLEVSQPTSFEGVTGRIQDAALVAVQAWRSTSRQRAASDAQKHMRNCV